MTRVRATIMTPALAFLAFIAIVAGVLGGLYFLDTHITVYTTDDDAIRQSASATQLRDVLWEPAKPLDLPGIVTQQEYEPKLSPDGNTLFLVRGKPGQNADIYTSFRTFDGWTEPTAFEAINSPEDDLGPSPTADGNTVYFYSNRAGSIGGYDLWVVHRVDNGWTAPENLGPAVNSPFNDYGPAIDADGTTMYFASNRPSTVEQSPDPDRWRATLREDLFSNDYDLYTATVTDGQLGQARPLRTLNSDRNEGAPAVSPYNDFLYYASDREGGLGGYDIYRARRIDGDWTAPETLGDSINSVANDMDPTLGMGGFQLFFSSNRDDNRLTTAAIDDAQDSAPLYRVFVSNSREVFARAETRKSNLDWPAILTSLLWLLALLLLLLLLLAYLRRLYLSGRLRKLSLLTQMLLLALLIHALIMFLKITNSIGPGLNRAGGTKVQLTTSADANSLTNQIRGDFTQIALDAPQTLTSIELPLLLQTDTQTQTALVPAQEQQPADAEQLASSESLDAQAPEFVDTTTPDEPLPELVADVQLQTPEAQKLARARETDLTVEVQQQAPESTVPPIQSQTQTQTALVPAQEQQSAEAEQLASSESLDAQTPEFTDTTTPNEPLPELAVDVQLQTPEAQKLARARETDLAVEAQQPTPQSDAPLTQTMNETQVALLAAASAQDLESDPLEIDTFARESIESPALRAVEPSQKIVTAAADTTIDSPSEAHRQQSQERQLAVAAQESQDTTPAPLPNRAQETESVAVQTRSAAVPTASQMVSVTTHDSAASIPERSELSAASQLEVLVEADIEVTTPIESQRADDSESTLKRIASPVPNVNLAAAPTVPDLVLHDATAVVESDRAASATEHDSMAESSTWNILDANPETAALDETPNDTISLEIPQESFAVDVSTPAQGATQHAASERSLAALTPGVRMVDATVPVVRTSVDELRSVNIEADSARQFPNAELTPVESVLEDAQLLPMPGIMADLDDVSMPMPIEDIALLDVPLSAVPDLPTSSQSHEESSVSMLAVLSDVPVDRAPALGVGMPEIVLAEIAALNADDTEPLPRQTMDISSGAMDAELGEDEMLASTTMDFALSFPVLPDKPLALPTELTPPNEEYAQRDEDVREEIIEEMGGTEETEQAVQMALEWLAKVQSADGRWDTDDFDDGCLDCTDDTSDISSDIALTGLALLCFQGAGHTHINPGPYRETISRGLAFLLSSQSASGDLRNGETMYSHGIATIALSEAFGMTSDEDLRDSVERATSFIIGARNRASRAPVGNRRAIGGWRYAPGQVGDTSVLGWQVMALRSATKAGIEIPEQIFDYAGQWLDQVRIEGNSGLYAYQPGDPPTFSMTAEAMFVRQLLGAEPDDSSMHRSVVYLLDEKPEWDSRANTYGWYYATLALFQHQGEAWKAWNEHIKDVLVGAQYSEGPARGSWPVADRWSRIGGRIYQTAICTLSLEVYYRYLPRFVTDAEDDSRDDNSSINAGE
jgi:WD40 repeat protein